MIAIEPLGDCAWLLRVPDETSAIQGLPALARSFAGMRLPGLLDVVPAWDSLALIFAAPDRCPAADVLQTELTRRMEQCAHRATASAEEPDTGALHCIEVRYGGEHGADLTRVARHTGMSERDVIARHCAVEYRVRFLGFLPGFAYLEGMDPILATPRLASPRPRIPAGSVGIAGTQTGIYPLDSPGGWNLIGHTQSRLFDPESARPFLLAPGDRVRFVETPA